ncbi:MAG: RNA 2',3'-cyclic phosphodiesterase [Bacillota bacterium]
MRLFYACWIPPDWAGENLLPFINRCKDADPQLKWVNPEMWHLTLAFLGETDPGRLPLLLSIGEQAAQTTVPVRLSPGRFGCFGKPHARVFWLGFKAETPDLSKMAWNIGNLLSKYKFPVDEKEFVPHLTLARAGRGKSVSPGLLSLARESRIGGAFYLTELALVKSVLKRGGPSYENAGNFPFCGGN